MKIKIRKASDYIFFLYIIMSFLSERSILGNISLVMLCVSAVCLIYNQKKFYNSKYFVFQIIFLLYCLIQNVTGVTEISSVANQRLQTLVICLVFEFCLYNYCMARKDDEYIGQMIVKGLAVALIVGVLINFESLLSGLRGVDSSGIVVAGIEIGVVNAVSIGWSAGIGIVLASVYFCDRKKIVFFYSYMIIFAFAIVISGTRKAVIFILLAYLIKRQMNENNFNMFLKVFKNMLLVGIVGAIFLLLILNVDVLYDMLGRRVEAVMLYIFTGEIGDSSLNTRLRLSSLAIDAFLQRPYTGWGLDNFKYVFYQGKYYTHNNFLEIAVSGGIVGFVLFYLKYLYLFIGLIKKWKNSIEREKKIAFSFIIAYIVFVILEYWQVTYFSRKSIIIYIFMLAYINMGKVAENKDD